MSDTDFTTFLRERERISTAFVNGDAATLEAISTHQSPATILALSPARKELPHLH